MSSAGEDILRLEELDVAYRVRRQDLPVLRKVSLSIGRGEAFGLVGESGCGKSTVALSAVRYLPKNGRVTGGRILIAGQDVLTLDDPALRRLRSSQVSMVYQDPGKALNPSLRIGRQLGEIFQQLGATRTEALERAETMLRRVQIADPAAVLQRYPHQLSGGMQQRVCIAAALAIDPALLVLDEPTTALDATVEAEVLDLIAQLRQEFGTSILFISHNLAVVARVCDQIGVLYAGELVETGTTARVLDDPHHPYTIALLRCLPRPGQRKDTARLDTIPGFLPSLGVVIPGCSFSDRCALAEPVCSEDKPALLSEAGRLVRCHFAAIAPKLPRALGEDAEAGAPIDRSAPPILDVAELGKSFPARNGTFRALQDISLSLWQGETLGLVGESGSGKSTLAKALVGLVPPDRGSRISLGPDLLPRDLASRSDAQVNAMQIVFQNPDSALNRAHPVRWIIGRALTRLAGVTGRAQDIRTAELAASVRLAERHLQAKPRQLSGGQKQRVAIAQAFAGAPKLVVCDEPTSALDVSVQAAILNLLVGLQVQHRVSYLFISHDLAVVRYLADRIAVIYLGRLMEIGPSESVLEGPHHPYTAALLSAMPSLDGDAGPRLRLTGEIPSAIDPPSGCVFHTRCRHRIAGVCEVEEPGLDPIGPHHAVRCHLPIERLDRA